MTGMAKLTEARVSPKTLAALLGMLATTLTLAGCGGPPSVAGIWWGEVTVPGEGTFVLSLDLQQAEEGALNGTAHVLAEGESPDEMGSSPVTGRVSDEGDVQVTAQNGLNVQGSVEGDLMDASLSVGGPQLAYDAERTTEEEYQARLESRRQAYEAEQERERQAAHEQSVRAARYEETAAKAGDLAASVEARMATLRGVDEDGPEEQLGDALGPSDTEEDLYACSVGGVACEVADLEERLQNDRQDVEEAAGDDYAPDPCDTVDFGYYEGYSLADIGGAEYLRVEGELREASEGLADEAEEVLQAAREAEAARAAYEEAGGSPSSLTYSVDEVERMAADAAVAERTTEEALARAGGRYVGYQRRVDEVKASAQALREEAGCAA